ncbi:MAG TPA: beta-galactosidase family protein [Candidatus Acidoferrales bacterium]|nr:beta-galactosidase family protein [Candidatus Acidoferrales bacterium]
MKNLALSFLLAVGVIVPCADGHTFNLSGNQFLLDDKPFQIISGEMHFARIPEEYWRARLKMAKAMGLNTVCTYVFWNIEEPEKGKFNFKGNADVAEFVRVAQQEGLWVLIRPSAYACAEWEFGGYPYWLLKERNLKVRSRDPQFLKMMKVYYEQLGKQLAPLQVTHGGPILMVQIENEYGSYGDDKDYLKTNERMMREAGFDVPFYTLDGIDMVSRGCVDGALPAVDGSINIEQIKDVVERNDHGHGPFFIGEWYPGWFDDWGKPFRTVPAKVCAEQLDTILAHGLSVNMYMAHGGTTRGFMNGANYSDNNPYSPQISSYDYDAPIDEAGNPTPKFYALREVINKFLPEGVVIPSVPPKESTIAIPKLNLQYAADITHLLPKPVHSIDPLTFEDINQPYGYILYRAKVKGPTNGTLDIVHVRDYAIVFINGKRTAVLDRRLNQETCEADMPDSENTLDIFVENLGRINYGKFINDNHKGITKSVLLDGHRILGWLVYGFPFEKQPDVTTRPAYGGQYPVIKEGSFELSEVGDTYLDMREWGKGHVWINGHNLGRYWYIGPQQTIYVPSPWLMRGLNTIVVFEELKTEQDEVGAIETAILNDVRNR